MPAKLLLTYYTYYTFSLQLHRVQEQEHGSYRHPNGGGIASIGGFPESPGSIAMEFSLQNAMSPRRRCAKCMTPARGKEAASLIWRHLRRASASKVHSRILTTTFVPRSKERGNQGWFILRVGAFHRAQSSKRNARCVFGHACNCWIARDLWPAFFGRGYLTFLSRMYGVRKAVAIMSPDNRSRSTDWRIFAGFDRLRQRYVPLRTIKALA